MRAGVDPGIDMVRSILWTDPRYAWGSLPLGWPVMEDMMRRQHRQCPIPSPAVAALVQRLFHRRQSCSIPEEVIVESVQSLLAGIAADPTSLQCPFWNEFFGVIVMCFCFAGQSFFIFGEQMTL